MNVSIKDSASILQLLDRSISMITPIIKWKFKDDKLGLNQIKEFEIANKNRKGI